MSDSVTDLRVLITAGGAGIGRAMTEVFHNAGARVHICDIVQASLDDTLASLPGVTATLADVSNTNDVERLFEDVRSSLGGLDCMINNAGIAGPTAKIEDIDIAEWERCIAVDVNGMFYCTRLAVPMLKSSGGGSIVNMSSSAGRLGFPYRTPYATAKWGVVGFTKSLSIELGEDNIRVNAIQPGIVEGERQDRVIEKKAKATGISVDEQRRRALQYTSMKKMVSPEDIANTALFLASPAGASITGQAISVCAGVEMLS